jgi:hypothetical protein
MTSSSEKRTALEARDAALAAELAPLEAARTKIEALGAAQALAQANARLAELQTTRKRNMVQVLLDKLPKSALAKDEAAIAEARSKLSEAAETAEIMAMGVSEIEDRMRPILHEREQIRLALIDLQGESAREWAQGAAAEYRAAVVEAVRKYARVQVVADWRNKIEQTGSFQPSYTGPRHSFGALVPPLFEVPALPVLDAFKDCRGSVLTIGLHKGFAAIETIDLEAVRKEVRQELAPLGINI